MENINDNIEQSESQNKAIAAWLQKGYALTSLEALRRFGCMRLASRICDLRQKFNMAIECRKIITASGKRVAEYRLAR